ncbi:hypothetical protein FACUT_11950 [Fusarium acutatum]|uniref:Metallo-beta-lactamase domain-containing protein n=1 Tax=Fusarium acutatum TaxID=78861 RepID=A0A8H4JCB1_9HYPO|nr:hypothetical protein FACUT_11950 [Fusarium acutatum]
MDGGRDAQRLRASCVVHAGLWLIAVIHNITGPYLRAWVVTHWDRDHYEGVLSLLKSGTLKGFVFMEGFSLYCASDEKVVPKASRALKDAGIQSTIKVGTNAIGYNFFGQDFNNYGVGFWCVGGDGYSYTKDFQLPPTPLEEQTHSDNIQMVCEKDAPTPNEKSLMAAIIWPNSRGTSRYSYFCAGDGNVPLEKKNVCPVVFGNKKVKAFKLDHHGSSGEFSGGEVLECMNLPQRLIVTPGHQYGHPCWDVLFKISKMYKEAKQNDGNKLLYTTRLPYWVDESRFGKWSSRDVNINHERIMSIELNKVSSRYTGILSGNETAKAFDKVIQNDQDQEINRKHWVKALSGSMMKEEDDEDESKDPDYIYEDALTDFLVEVIKNRGAIYESIYDRVTEELSAAGAGKQGKLEMEPGKKKGKDDIEEEKPSKSMDEVMENMYEVVTACVCMWNSISEQEIREGVPQTRYFLLQMVSANDNDLDGVVRSYEWPEMRDWVPKSHF